jgi:hypothetical protein
MGNPQRRLRLTPPGTRTGFRTEVRTDIRKPPTPLDIPNPNLVHMTGCCFCLKFWMLTAVAAPPAVKPDMLSVLLA